MKLKLMCLALAFSLTACNTNYHYQIEVWSGGTKIATYNSYFPPTQESNGKWSFYDSDSDELVEVAGTVISKVVKNAKS